MVKPPTYPAIPTLTTTTCSPTFPKCRVSNPSC